MISLDKFRNRLIVLEGLDECGKTTVGKLLVQKLNDNDIPAIFTFQPGDVEYGIHASILRSMCKDKRWNLHPLSNMFAFYIDKIEQVTKIVMPALERGVAVVSDRWLFSTVAYQECGKKMRERFDMSPEVCDWLNNISEMYVTPDVIMYFSEKITNIQGVRDSDAKSNDLFESASDMFKKRVHESYEQQAIMHDFKRVVLGKTAEETLENILTINF